MSNLTLATSINLDELVKETDSKIDRSITEDDDQDSTFELSYFQPNYCREIPDFVILIISSISFLTFNLYVVNKGGEMY